MKYLNNTIYVLAILGWIGSCSYTALVVEKETDLQWSTLGIFLFCIAMFFAPSTDKKEKK